MTTLLQPIPDTDRIRPGHCVLVLWRSCRNRATPDISDYWLGVVCPISMLPEQVAKSRPSNAALTSWPVWLIGESTFLWVPRSKTYSLTEAQRAKYKENLGPDFATYFTLAKENHGNLEYWRDVIIQHKKSVEGKNATLAIGKDNKRVREGGDEALFIRDDESSGAEASDDSHLEDSDDEGPARKKIRSTATRPVHHKTEAGLRSLTAPSPPPSMNGLSTTPTASFSAPSATIAASSQDVFIKEEQDDYHGIPVGDLVEVFVGPNATRFECSRTNLTQSDVLTGRITARDGVGHHPFVMDPTFLDIDPSEFKAVVQFLHAREYEPFLHHLSDGKFCLEDSLAPIDYEQDLIRYANLFNLAKRFQLPAFGNLVLRKVLHGHPKYDTRVFLSFASTVLGYNEMDFRDEDEIKGVLEDWIIKFLAENMATICSRVRRDAEAFWRLMQVKGVESRVMEMKVELCKKYPGGRVKIED